MTSRLCLSARSPLNARAGKAAPPLLRKQPSAVPVVASSARPGSGSAAAPECKQSRRGLLASGVLIGLAGSGTLGVQQGLASEAEPSMIVASAEVAEKEPFLQSTGAAELKERIARISCSCSGSRTLGK